MNRIKAFAEFWYDFVVGDDWRLAAGVVVAVLLTWGLALASVSAWWLMAAAVAVILAVSTVFSRP